MFDIRDDIPVPVGSTKYAEVRSTLKSLCVGQSVLLVGVDRWAAAMLAQSVLKKGNYRTHVEGDLEFDDDYRERPRWVRVWRIK